MEPFDAGQAGLGQATAQTVYVHGAHEGSFLLSGLAIDYDHHGSGRSEDAPPIWVFTPPSHGLIGVFDGLGGAGGETIRLTDGSEHSGAWLASRFTRNCVLDVYHKLLERALQASSGGEPHPFVDFTAELRRALEASLSASAAQIRAGRTAGLLRSKLIKMLPTTMAICSYNLKDGELAAIWAGDSRVFSLRPDEGLQQITVDDLKSGADPLENLIQDSPMSNFVNADTDFILHERRLPLQPHTILIAASDGCFGYLQTPLHFEHAILSTMQESANWAGWEERLGSRIIEITGDDSTLSAAAVGWPDFTACRAQYAARADWCAQRVGAYDEHRDAVRTLERDLARAREDLASKTQALWQEYRVTYEGLTLAQTRDFPKDADSHENASHPETDESS